MILAADVGGTKVNLGLFELRDNKLGLAREGTMPSHNFGSLQDLVKDFLKELNPQKIERACFGVAGPVKKGSAKLTNLPWRIESTELASDLDIGQVFIINDLEANGHGLAELTAADLCTLNDGAMGASGNGAIISAGTGLGEAGLFWDGHRNHAFACEGGHSNFAPCSELDAELLVWLNQRFGHASWERVLSGEGLHNIYTFLRETNRGEEPVSFAEALAKSDPAAAISQAAMNGSSSRCIQAQEMFVTYYGSEAGNLALKLMATGGVYVGGGIAPKILPWLRKENFLNAFFTKGRMRSLLEAMPVRVILNPKTALLGAAHYAAFRGEPIE